MLTESQRQRFRTLQQKEDTDTLSPTEQAELQAFVQFIEDEEARYLRPATQRIKERNLQLAAQNAALKTLVEREKRLNGYLQRVLRKVDNERQSIATELASILEASAVSGTGR